MAMNGDAQLTKPSETAFFDRQKYKPVRRELERLHSDFDMIPKGTITRADTNFEVPSSISHEADAAVLDHRNTAHSASSH